MPRLPTLLYITWIVHCQQALYTGQAKDVRFLKIAHFEKFLEIKNIYDLDKNFYNNSHYVNAFQASRYEDISVLDKKIISNF